MDSDSDAEQPEDDPTLPADVRRTMNYAARWVAVILAPEWRYVHEAQQWLHWDGHRWAPTSTGVPAVMDAVDAIQRDVAERGDSDLWKWAVRLGNAARQLTELVTHLAPLRVDSDALDTHDRILATPEGDLHLWDDGSWSIVPSDPARLITRTLRVAPASEVRPCRFWEWLAWFTGDDADLADYLAEVIAAAISVERTQTINVLEGGGGNGKTTLGNILRYVLGSYAAVTPRGLITVGRDTVTDEIAALRGVRLLIDEESRAGDRLDESKVKQLTGSEHLNVRHLFGRWHEIRWVAQIVHLTNALPDVEDMSDGIWRRLRHVPITAKIATQDRTVEAALREDADQILLWILGGWARLATGRQTMPERIRAATAAYREDSDHVQTWIDDACHVAPTLTCDAGALWRSWLAWCHDNSQRPGTQNALGRRLTALGYPARRDKRARQRVGLAPHAPASEPWGTDA